jgi:hypothetical protein
MFTDQEVVEVLELYAPGTWRIDVGVTEEQLVGGELVEHTLTSGRTMYVAKFAPWLTQWTVYKVE